MNELMNPRVPGLGLAAARASDVVPERWYEAVVREAMLASSGTSRVTRVTNLFGSLARRARSGEPRPVADRAAASHTSQSMARASRP